MTKIQNRVKELTEEQGTAEPENICENMGIIVLSLDLPERVNGFTMKQNGIWFIVLNNMLNDDQKRFTTAHELGHIILHGCTNSINLSCNTGFCVSRYEREADLFAAYLLLQAEYDQYVDYETLTLNQVSQITHIPQSKVDKLFF